MTERFFDRLMLAHPLIVAPMAGGPTTPQLVAACSAAGALGSLGAAYSKPADIATQVAQVRTLTDKPFAVNLFLPHPTVTLDPDAVQAAVAATRDFRDAWGMQPAALSPPFEQDFDGQFEAVLAAKPAMLSFVFGALDETHTRAAQRRGILLVGAATTLDEAQQLQDSQVDAITLQGFEAGGHRAIFDQCAAEPEVALHALLRACRRVIQTPLIAAGGLMNHEAIAAALRAGAQAVQLGTAFLCCEESGTSAPYRRALATQPRTTTLSRAFSGRLARGIENEFMRVMADRLTLPFPAQNVFTRDLRAACVRRDSTACLSMWCGTGEGALWTGTAGALIDRLFL